jgi:hypothetical protein
MKNNANPIVDQKSKTIVEYPVNQWANIPPNQRAEPSQSQFTRESADQREPTLLDATDWAHRHFSSLHWLYPGTFIPYSSKEDESILRAAQQTLQMKSTSLGGHTG